MLYYKSTTLFACGKRGIRTLGTRKGTTVFETVPFDRSGIFPGSFAATKVQKFSLSAKSL